MSLSRRRFRIEDGVGRPHSGAERPSHRIPATDPEPDGAGPTDARESWIAFGRLAADIFAMRDAIATTKRELGDIQRIPSGTVGIGRAACELDAVSAATERATTAILSAVEEIELAANILRGSATDVSRAASVEVILDRVLSLYEACNFQDVAGQRLRKVVGTLKFVEERLDRVIAAWAAAPAASPTPRPPGRDGPSGAGITLSDLARGPSLPGDEGHVSQAEVDAYFA